jgi:tetratricopeptide (TPR) repeat protein
MLAALAIPLGAGPAAGEQRRLLVVPFETEREPRQYWLSEGAAVLLADDLTVLGAAAIARNQRVRAFEALNLPTTATLSRATVIKVGQLVGATEIVVGSLELEGDELTVRARAIRLDTGRIESEILERGPLAQLFPIFERVARRLNGQPASAPPLERAYPPLEAFESYVKGLLAEAPATQARFLEAALQQHKTYDRARLALWETRTGEGNHKAALAIVSAVPAGSAFSRRARFRAALSRLELRQYDEAFTGLQALESQQSAPAIENNLAIVQLRRGWSAQTGLPSYYFHKAVKAQPDDPDYLFNLGYAYVMERDLPAAIYWLREAVRRNPADGDAHFVLGLALQSTGHAAEGAREKELARQLSSKYEEWERRAAPDKEPFPKNLERLRIELETPLGWQLGAAMAVTAQREQRDLAQFHLDRGRRLYQQESDREAIAELRRSIYLSPYQAEAHLLLGRLYLRGGRTREAIDELKISIWSTETAAAQVALGEAYLKAVDLAAARAAAERALVLDPASADAKRLLADIGKER